METLVADEPTVRRRRALVRNDAVVEGVQWLLVVVVAAVSAWLATKAGASPTGNEGPDRILAAVVGGGTVVIGAFAPFWALAVIVVLAMVASRQPGAIAAGLLGLAACIPAALMRRRVVVLAAVTSAVVVQIALRLPFATFGVSSLVASALILLVVGAGLVIAPNPVRGATAVVAGLAAIGAVVALGAGVVSVVFAQDDLQKGVDKTSTGLDQLGRGDLDVAQVSFRDASEAFAKADDRLGGSWTAGLRWVPALAQHRAAALAMIEEGRSLTTTASATVGRLEPGALQLKGGSLDLEAVAALRAPLEQLQGDLQRSVARVQGIDSTWLIGPAVHRIDDVEIRLQRAAGDSRNAAEAARVLPGVMGASGPRRYLVVFTNPSRPTAFGGSIEGYATVTATDGQLAGETIGLAADLAGPLPDGSEPTDHTDLSVVGPELIARASKVQQLPIDGMVVADPFAIAELLRFAGTIDVPGVGSLAPDDAAAFLLKRQYTVTQASDAAGLAGIALVGRLVTADFPSASKVGDALSPVVHAGRLAAWSPDPEVQGVIASIGMDRPPRRAAGDSLMVAVDDLGASRLGPYLRTSIDQRVTVDPSSGRVTTALVVRVANTTPDGLSAAVLGAAGDGSAKLRVTVETPLTGSPAPGSSVDVKLQPPRASEAKGFATEVDIAPGTTAELRFDLQGTLVPPAPASGAPPYALEVRPQPMVEPTRVDLRVQAPATPLRSVSGPLGPGPDGSLVFGGELMQPLLTTVAPTS